MMTWDFSKRALFGLLWLMISVGTLSLGCGEDAATEPVGSDSAGPDSGGPDSAGLDTAGPDVGDDTSYDAASFDANLPQSEPDAGTYTLAPNSIITCGQFFECVQDCRAEHNSCMGPCNEAMTDEAASMVHRFMNCVAASGCRSGGCIAQRCGEESQACFASPY